MANPVDNAGRAIAGLLGYNPGPGIYSRLERAIEQMPANVRAEELPGLLKRYKDGVPGWELSATDLPGLIGDSKVIPRQDLLDRVRERSPVFTHGEVVLGGRPQMQEVSEGSDWLSSTTARPDYQFPDTGQVSRLGLGVSHGPPKYRDYGQGGQDYTELLLVQPRVGGDYGSHWADDTKDAVAHARFDTHGDALRINELQSDLGIHNRKTRESLAKVIAGGPVEYPPLELPFPLEDAWSDILIKRLALEAARKGHRAIEIASPRAIADKVGGNIDNYEHFYGKVVPGAIERLGRKMGGLTPDFRGVAADTARAAEDTPVQFATHQTLRDLMREATGEEQLGPQFWRLYSGMRYDSLPPMDQIATYDRFGGSHPISQVDGGLPQEMYDYLHSLGLPPGAAQRITSQALYLAPHNARAMHNVLQQEQLESIGSLIKPRVGDVGRRYLMSDEMRKRILTQGIGASVLAPVAAAGMQQE